MECALSYTCYPFGVILAVSILLFISNFGIGGAIGNAVSSFFFGVFGLIAYIFPVVLVIGTFFAASNKGNRIATVKIVAAVFFVLFLCMFIEIVRCGAEVAGAAGAYQYCSVHKIGGGFLGGLLAGIFCPNFGLLGSYVIDVVAMIICLVLITERSALKGVQKGSRKVYETAKESNERHRELAEQRREERELRRMDRKVEGVAVDTRVLPDRKAEPMGSDEVSEINIDKLLEQSNANLPEIKEEKHVTLTAGGAEYQKLPAMESETELYVAPSAFSEEAFEAKELEEDASIFHSEPAYQAAEGYGELLARCAAEELGGQFDTVTWVPVSKKREHERGYDQAYLLAKETARHWGIEPMRLLRKTRNNAAQSGLSSAAERRGNVLGVYEAENTDRIRGAKILLIDDILTTGATLGECVRVLREAGAADVVCATLARAVTEKEKDGARRGTPV